MRYFKILNSEEMEFGYKYHNGLNGFGGKIYFSDIIHIFAFIDYGTVIREVHIPNNTYVYEDGEFMSSEVDEYIPKWYSSNLILGDAYSLGDVNTIKYLISLGADFRCNNYAIVDWAYSNNYSIYVYLKSLMNDYDLMVLSNKIKSFM